MAHKKLKKYQDVGEVTDSIPPVIEERTWTNPWNPDGSGVSPEPGGGGMILPEGGRTWNTPVDIIGEKIRLEELYNESIPQGGFNINEGLFPPSIDTSYVKKEGGQVLKSFKSAARFDQPKFKNGRRTKG